MQQEILHIDATPNETYPLRILQAYRRLGDSQWSTSSDKISEDSAIVKQMNEWQAKRNEFLDRAIEILASQLMRPADGDYCDCLATAPGLINRDGVDVCDECYRPRR